MSQAAAKFLARRFLGDRVGNIIGQKDPYFEQQSETPVANGNSHKLKKKALPPGLTPKEVKILKKVRRRAYRLDRSITCCCCSFRIGWSAVIGIIPMVGDVIKMVLCYNIIKVCKQAEMPASIESQMYANMAFDFGVGLVPVAGDLVDMIFKANTRNNILLERVLRERGRKRLIEQGRDPNAPVDNYQATNQNTWNKFFSPKQQQPPPAAAAQHPSSSLQPNVQQQGYV